MLAGKHVNGHRSYVLGRLENGMSYMDAPVVRDVRVVEDYSLWNGAFKMPNLNSDSPLRMCCSKLFGSPRLKFPLERRRSALSMCSRLKGHNLVSACSGPLQGSRRSSAGKFSAWVFDPAREPSLSKLLAVHQTSLPRKAAYGHGKST